MSEPKNPIEISPAARLEMDAICRRATSRDDSQSGVRDELFGHLEDKLIGYLNGEERLTEADAMVLVREHFGRPEALRPILSYIHAEPEHAGPPLWRLVAGACALLAATTLIARLLREGVSFAVIGIAIKRGMNLPWLGTWFWSGFALENFVIAAMLYAAVRRWCSPKSTEGAWLTNWTPKAIALVLVGLLVTQTVLFNVIFHSRASLPPYAGLLDPPSQNVQMFLSLLGLAALVLQCLAWVAWVSWWARRGWRIPILAAGAWVLYFPLWHMARSMVQLVFPSGQSTLSYPWYYYAAFDAINVAIAAGPALALYFTPRWYRWLSARNPLRVGWAAGSSGG